MTGPAKAVSNNLPKVSGKHRCLGGLEAGSFSDDENVWIIYLRER